MSKNSALKRILNKDIKEIENQNLRKLGIYIHFNETNMFEAKAMITGPKGSLYEYGFLFFNITFPNNYPYSPPDISYVSRNKVRIHPNLYVSQHSSGFGKVCLSILGTWSGPKWSTIMDITTVLITIQSLLDNNPLHHEPGQEKNTGKQNELYNEIIRYESINTLLIKNFIDPPYGFDIFHNEMIEEIKNIDKVKLLEKLKGLLKKYPNENIIEVPIYRIRLKTNYQELLLKCETNI
tara:strand:+ start:363 stop:1073 length:711 start_codon:yes stop_codon:yes gene_type:complete